MDKNFDCYIRFNLNLLMLKIEDESPEVSNLKKESSMTNCSNLCFKNSKCSAWSYQIATKICVQFSRANRSYLHSERTFPYLPKSSSNNDGWISGLNTCHSNLKGFIYFKIFKY